MLLAVSVAFGCLKRFLLFLAEYGQKGNGMERLGATSISSDVEVQQRRGSPGVMTERCRPEGLPFVWNFQGSNGASRNLARTQWPPLGACIRATYARELRSNDYIPQYVLLFGCFFDGRR